MIGKIIAGSSFAGTVGYVMKEQSRILAAEGITPPDFSDSSTCVSRCCLRMAFTYFDNVVCILYLFGYKNSEIIYNYIFSGINSLPFVEIYFI